jgi:nucleotide-binding universal stress UspA family protein
MKRARHVLHATDFSRASRPAFASALALAKQNRARFCLLPVLMPPSPFLGNRLPPSYLEFEARARRQAERHLAALVTDAKRAGVRMEAHLTESVPAEEILRAARRQRAGVIVIGAHDRTGLGRIFMGSVAARVLQQATIPVLTVRR